MKVVKYTILFIVIYFLQLAGAFSQENKEATAEDIFGDLPINDPASHSELRENETAEQKIKKNIFVSGILNKTRCYLGEPVLLSFELLSALKSTSTIQKLPSFDGFLTINMDVDNDFPKFIKKKGLTFNVFTIKQIQLIPDKEGNIEIGPLAVTNEVNYTKNNKSYNYAGATNSPPLTLMVQQLPVKGKPKNFSGSIGDFTIKASVISDSFSAGENNMLEIVINGAGNFYSLKAPSVYWPSALHNFDLTEKSTSDENSFPVKGSKIISIPFVAEQTGNFTIPSIELDFFDPSKGLYRKSVTDDIHLLVVPAISNLKNSLTTAVDKKQAGKNFLWQYSIAILAVISFFVVIADYGKKRSMKKRKITEEAQRKEAEVEAIKKLENEKTKNVYANIAKLESLAPGENYVIQFKKALIEYLHMKLKTLDALPEEMIASIKLIEGTAGNELEQLIYESEMFLYSGTPLDNTAREKLLSRLHALTKRIDQLS